MLARLTIAVTVVIALVVARALYYHRSRVAIDADDEPLHAVVIQNGLTEASDLYACVRHVFASARNPRRVRLHLFVDASWLPIANALLKCNLMLPTGPSDARGAPIALLALKRTSVHGLRTLARSHDRPNYVHAGVNYLHALKLALGRLPDVDAPVALLPSPRACVSLTDGWDAPDRDRVVSLGGMLWLSAGDSDVSDGDAEDVLWRTSGQFLRPNTMLSQMQSMFGGSSSSLPACASLSRDSAGVRRALVHPEATIVPSVSTLRSLLADANVIGLCTAPTHREWLSLAGKSSLFDTSGASRLFGRVLEHPSLAGDRETAHMLGIDDQVEDVAQMAGMFISESSDVREAERELATLRDSSTCSRATTLEIVLFNLLLGGAYGAPLSRVAIDEPALVCDIFRGNVQTVHARAMLEAVGASDGFDAYTPLADATFIRLARSLT